MTDTLNTTLVLTLLDRVTAPLKGMQAGIGQLNTHLKALRGLEVPRTLTGQLGEVSSSLKGLFGSIIQSSIDLEKAMANVRKVVNFDSPQQFKEMGRDLQTLSTRIPLPPKQLAQITAASGQLGIPRVAGSNLNRLIAQLTHKRTQAEKIYNAPVRAIQSLLVSLNKLEPKAKQQMIQNTFGHGGGVSFVGKLTGGIDEFNRVLSLVTDITGKASSVDKEFGIRNATTTNAIGLLHNNLNNISTEIGNAFLPTLSSLSVRLGRVLEGVQRWMQNHPILSRILVISTAIVGGLLVAVAALASTLLFLASPLVLLSMLGFKWASLLRLLTPLQWALNLAMDANPIGLIVVGITALVAAFYYLGNGMDGIIGGFKILSGLILEALFTPINLALVAVEALIKGLDLTSTTGLESLIGAINQPKMNLIQEGWKQSFNPPSPIKPLSQTPAAPQNQNVQVNVAVDKSGNARTSVQGSGANVQVNTGSTLPAGVNLLGAR